MIICSCVTGKYVAVGIVAESGLIQAIQGLLQQAILLVIAALFNQAVSNIPLYYLIASIVIYVAAYDLADAVDVRTDAVYPLQVVAAIVYLTA